jgi:terminase small subunit-like protein
MADGVDPPALGAGRGMAKYVRYSEALGAEICARVRAGESLASVCRGRAMPHPATAYAWAEEWPAFGAALREAQQAARLAARAADRARAAARFAAGRDGRGLWSTYTPELGEEICRRIAAAESLKSIGEDEAMPCAATILNWARQYPAFGDAYALARQQMADLLFDEAREVALAATPHTVWAERLRFDTIRWMTARMAPKKYCERVIVEAEAVAMRAREDAARDAVTVVIRRFTDAPDPEAGEYPEID